MRTRKLVRALWIPVLTCYIVIVSACVSTPTPDIEATVQARLIQEAAQKAAIATAVQQTADAQPTETPRPPEPSPTRVPPTPTRVPPTPTPTPPPTPTRLPPTPTRVPIIIPTRIILPTMIIMPTQAQLAPLSTATPTFVPPAVTYSTGPLEIPQTWTADLDEGVVGAGSDADIWFEAVTATERYLTPLGGARIAVVGTSPVGRDGCAAAPLSTARIHVNGLPEGTYVCVRTNLGRYSQFRVNAPIGSSPGMLVIGYITWE